MTKKKKHEKGTPEESTAKSHEQLTEEKKLTGKEYEKELAKLHAELVKLQEWVKVKELKVCVNIG